MSGLKKIFTCFLFLKFLVELACFICVCILCGLSAKNPFKNHIIGDLNTYFKGIKRNATSNISMLRYFDGKHYKSIKPRMLNIYKNSFSKNNLKKNIYLRKLVSIAFCSEMQSYFMEFQGTKLSNIFDFNYEKILGLSIAILAVSCVLLLCFLMLMFCEKLINKLNIYCQCSYAVFIILLYDARFVLSIILFYYIEKGDIEKYDDFLDCSNVKSKFFNKFSSINRLRNCFLAFLILNIIVQGIEKIEKCFENIDKYRETESNSNNISYTS